MNYLTIIDNQGGLWTETQEEAWDIVIGGADKHAQIIDLNGGRFTDITIGGGSKSMQGYFLTPDEVAGLRARNPNQMRMAA